MLAFSLVLWNCINIFSFIVLIFSVQWIQATPSGMYQYFIKVSILYVIFSIFLFFSFSFSLSEMFYLHIINRYIFKIHAVWRGIFWEWDYSLISHLKFVAGTISSSSHLPIQINKYIYLSIHFRFEDWHGYEQNRNKQVWTWEWMD